MTKKFLGTGERSASRSLPEHGEASEMQVLSSESISYMFFGFCSPSPAGDWAAGQCDEWVQQHLSHVPSCPQQFQGTSNFQSNILALMLTYQNNLSFPKDCQQQPPWQQNKCNMSGRYARMFVRESGALAPDLMFLLSEKHVVWFWSWGWLRKGRFWTRQVMKKEGQAMFLCGKKIWC